MESGRERGAYDISMLAQAVALRSYDEITFMRRHEPSGVGFGVFVFVVVDVGFFWVAFPEAKFWVRAPNIMLFSR